MRAGVDPTTRRSADHGSAGHEVGGKESDRRPRRGFALRHRRSDHGSVDHARSQQRGVGAVGAAVAVAGDGSRTSVLEQGLEPGCLNLVGFIRGQGWTFS